MSAGWWIIDSLAQIIGVNRPCRSVAHSDCVKQKLTIDIAEIDRKGTVWSRGFAHHNLSISAFSPDTDVQAEKLRFFDDADYRFLVPKKSG